MDVPTLDDLIVKAFAEAEELIANQDRFNYPFRNRFRHTKRVLNWAKRIQQHEGGDMDVITLAVLFHDTGWSDEIDHALIGADLAEKFLVGHGVDQSVIDRVAFAARTHNKRQAPRKELPIENLIVMDADLLDEVGVTTIVWDAMATALEENPSYKAALDKSQRFFEGAKEKEFYLQTKTGKELYRQRIAMWEKCLDHLRYELGESAALAD